VIVKTKTKYYYAGIGSRKTPEHVLEFMTQTAKLLSEYPFILRTGGAEGADIAFESGALLSGKLEVYLPWKRFNGLMYDTYDICDDAMKLAEQYHPRFQFLKPGAKKLMARNGYQVLGKRLNDPVEFVICYTPKASGSGGTGQAIRIARDYNIPVYDLGFFDKKELPSVSYFVENLIQKHT
jgi:hypothetical protein